MNATDETMADTVSGKAMKYGMWVCCAVMVLPIVAVFAVGGASAVSGSLSTFATLLLCLGLHLVMHRFMGKSCNGKAHTAKTALKPREARPIARSAAE